jgi:ribosomal protein S18 acetylase RimI-like enzyme
MLEALLNRASKIAGIVQISLSVTKTQMAALSLYRSLGFEPFGCEPGAVKIGDRFLDEEYLVWRVKTVKGES